MSAIRLGLEILSVCTGLIAGYFVGKWDSRLSDLGIFKELAAGIAALVHNVVAESDDEDLPEDEEILKSRDKWFAPTITRIQQERSRSWKLALAFACLTLVMFSVSQLIS